MVLFANSLLQPARSMEGPEPGCAGGHSFEPYPQVSMAAEDSLTAYNTHKAGGATSLIMRDKRQTSNLIRQTDITQKGF